MKRNDLENVEVKCIEGGWTEHWVQGSIGEEKVTKNISLEYVCIKGKS